MSSEVSQGKSLLRLPAVMRATGLGRSSVYALMSDGKFPAAIHLGGVKMTAWVSTEIEQWIEEQIERARSAA